MSADVRQVLRSWWRERGAWNICLVLLVSRYRIFLFDFEEEMDFFWLLEAIVMDYMWKIDRRRDYLFSSYIRYWLENNVFCRNNRFCKINRFIFILLLFRHWDFWMNCKHYIAFTFIFTKLLTFITSGIILSTRFILISYKTRVHKMLLVDSIWKPFLVEHLFESWILNIVRFYTNLIW